MDVKQALYQHNLPSIIIMKQDKKRIPGIDDMDPASRCTIDISHK